MIYRDIAPRGSGKSTRILKQALETGCCICTADKMATRHFMHLAEQLGVRATEMKMEETGVLHIRDFRVADILYWYEHTKTEKNITLLCDELTMCMNRILNGKVVGYSDDNGDDERRIKNA